MCLGNPDICRCSMCFHARLQPKEYAYRYPILTVGPFYSALKKIEEDEKRKSEDSVPFKFPDLLAILSQKYKSED